MADGEYKITLYTYYGCPYAHRVHIALEELGLAYDRVLIDLDKPREPWYLQINPVRLFPPHPLLSLRPLAGANPAAAAVVVVVVVAKPHANAPGGSPQRGLVPALKIAAPALGSGEHILIESGIIVQFLADLLPSGRLELPSNTVAGAMQRARLNFFIDTWNTKVGPFMFNLFKAQTAADRESFSRDWVGAVRKEIEPLLADAAPYFGGSQRLTLAEVSPAAPILILSLIFCGAFTARGRLSLY
jgi:glutathione S-transferase